MEIVACWTIAVLMHELAHHAAALCFGVRTKRVSLFIDGWGFALGRFKLGNTTFQLGWLPISGYVDLAGLEKADHEIPLSEQFWAKRLTAQWSVLMAGPIASAALCFASLVIMDHIDPTGPWYDMAIVSALLNGYLAMMSLLPVPGSDISRTIRCIGVRWFLSTTELRALTLVYTVALAAACFLAREGLWDLFMSPFERS